MSAFFRKLGWLWRRRDKEADLREELEFHLSQESAERETEGAAGGDARWAARRELGNLALVEEDTRAAWGWPVLEQLAQDVRYAFRTMRQNRAFTVLAVLSLALGIGANTAIYSFMDAILLRALPVANPETLAVLNWRIAARSQRGSVIHSGSGSMWRDGKTGTAAGIFPYPAFELLRSTGAVFSSVFAYYPTREINVIVKSQAEVQRGEYVSGEYFGGLGVNAAAGRLIDPGDDREGSPAVAVLSYGCSQRRFGDPASALGQSIIINNVPFTVVGVAPPEFFGIDPASAPEIYIPFHTNLLLAAKNGSSEGFRKGYLDQNYYWVEMAARLKPGVTLARAQSELGPVFERWASSTAENDKERTTLPKLWIREGTGGLDNLRRKYSEPLYVLLAMVGLILAIACANIANLLLARATARRREMAVRLSMGAGRFRVIRQLLTESVVLASMGGTLGVLFAIWGVRFLTVLLANGRENFTLHAELNWQVLAVAAGLSMLTGVLFGLMPALQATKVDVMPVLKESRGTDRRPRIQYGFMRVTLSQVLVVSQIAISLLMLVAAGLFVRTLSNLESIAIGFNREHLLLFTLNAHQAGHKNPEIVSFYSDLQKRFSELPGVRAASASNSPLVGEGSWMTPAAPVGKEPISSLTTHVMNAGAGYFEAMQLPILAGRGFDARDRAGTPAVAVVNEAWAKVNFGDQNPIGQQIYFANPGRLKPIPMEIIGLARNTRYGDLKGDYPAIVFVPFVQGVYYPVEEVTFALRTAGDPLGYANAVRQIVREADSHVPVTKIRSQAAQVDQTINQEIIFARLCTGFAGLALVIACVGLYGTMAYTVARRTGEIGIRMALGARRGHVVRMVMGQVLVMAIAGLAIGVPVVKTLSKLVEAFLFGIQPNDPTAIWAAIATLVLAALAAGYGPAWRASHIDPMEALRHE
jgi:predicted permease